MIISTKTARIYNQVKNKGKRSYRVDKTYFPTARNETNGRGFIGEGFTCPRRLKSLSRERN